jgi:elongator complex protein 2
MVETTLTPHITTSTINPTLYPQLDSIFISSGASRQRQATCWSSSGNLYYLSEGGIFVAKQVHREWASPNSEENASINALVVDHALICSSSKPLCLAQSGYILVSGHSNGEVNIWNPEARQVITTFGYHKAPIQTVSVLESCDRAWIMSSDTTGCICIWYRASSTSSWTLSQTWSLIRYAVSSTLSLAPEDLNSQDGLTVMLILGTADAKLLVYLCGQGDEPQFNLALTLKGHENWITTLDVITIAEPILDLGLVPGDVLLASGSNDRMIRLWRFTRQDALMRPKGQVDELENADEELLAMMEAMQSEYVN